MELLIYLIVLVCVVNSLQSNITETDQKNSTVMTKRIDTHITNRMYFQPNCGGNVYPPDSRPPFYPDNPNYPTYPERPNCPPNSNYPTYPQYPNYPTYPQYPTHPTYPQYPEYPNNPQIPPTYPQYPEYPSYPQIPPTYPQNPPNYPEYPTRYPDTLPLCCSNVYNERHFYISSPGFPYSSNIPSDCLYILYRSDPNVCQLRLYFKFFWNGESGNSNDCNRGFLEIDGKRFCGCRTGLTVISRFSNYDTSQKVFRFRNEGYPKTSFQGFSIEVIQETCSNRPRSKRQMNSTSHVTELKQVPNVNLSRRLETFDEDETKPNITVYFYEDPRSVGEIDLSGSSTTNTFNKEPKDILDTSSSSFFLQPVGDLICKKWTMIEWFALAGLSLFQRTGQCRRDQNLYPSIPPSPNNCALMDGFTGWIQSPGYPLSYQKNLRICYRFQRKPGYCGVRLLMQDFDIEKSNDCRKDYYSVGQYRYCGTALANREIIIDLSTKQYEDTYFVTDNSLYHCGRGFRGNYHHISCELLPPPTTNRPGETCGGVFSNPSFAIQQAPGVFAQSRCDYVVYKSSPNICSVLLSFTNFKLDCSSEYLLVNNRRFCGQLSGKIYKFDFIGNQMNIVYFKTNPLSKTGFFLIVGQQSDSCDQFTLNVPAERVFLHTNTTNTNISLTKNVKKIENVI